MDRHDRSTREFSHISDEIKFFMPERTAHNVFWSKLLIAGEV